MPDTHKTLLIADDHPIFRQGLKQIIKEVSWLKLISEAESGDSALTQIRHSKPDIVILDIAMPGMDGLKVLEQALKIEPKLLAIIITSYDDQAYLKRALSLGARAYLIKDGAAENIVACLEAVNKGEQYISNSLKNRVVKLPNLGEASAELLESLTETERLVLTLVAQFQTSKEIARKMDISYRTVQNHRANINQKLDIKGTHQLMSFARLHYDVLKSSANPQAQKS